MNNAGSAKKIKLNSYEDLFGTDNAGDVLEVELSKLHPFNGHPFKVLDNEDMQNLVDSIRLHGKVLQPGLVRPRTGGGYEIISGHRRCHASKLAGFKTMPVIVRELSDEEATIIMVDSNIQREHLLYSEKAYAYKMKFEALKHPGSRLDKTTAEKLAEEAGESGRNIQRYIRLTELIPEFLSMLDAGKLKFVAAVDLSFLNRQEQKEVCDKLSQGGTINGSQAAKLKKYSQSGGLNARMIELILAECKTGQKKIVLKQDIVSRYFSDYYSDEQIEDVIVSLLEQWKNKQEQNWKNFK